MSATEHKLKAEFLTDMDDPRAIMVENFRSGALQMFMDATRITVFRELGQQEQFATFVSGMAMALAQFHCASLKGDACETFWQEFVHSLPGLFAMVRERMPTLK